MGSYYTSIKTPLRPGPRLSLPHMDSRLGLMVTLSLPLIQNGSFTGVVAVDLPLERLFKEALQLSYASLTYAVLVDKEGKKVSLGVPLYSLTKHTSLCSRRNQAGGVRKSETKKRVMNLFFPPILSRSPSLIPPRLQPALCRLILRTTH